MWGKIPQAPLEDGWKRVTHKKNVKLQNAWSDFNHTRYTYYLQLGKEHCGVRYP